MRAPREYFHSPYPSYTSARDRSIQRSNSQQNPRAFVFRTRELTMHGVSNDDLIGEIGGSPESHDLATGGDAINVPDASEWERADAGEGRVTPLTEATWALD